jgi:hypothetical protein
MEILRIRDIMRKPAIEVWAERVGEAVLNSFIQRPNGGYVYNTTGQPTINRQFINAAGLESKAAYTLVDGFAEDKDGLFVDLVGSSIIPVEIKYRSKTGNYQLNAHQLAIPGVIHLLYDRDFTRVREYTFEQLAGMANWRIANQLQFNPDQPGKTLREVFLDMHADISRVERRLNEKDKTSWLYSLAKDAAEATLATAVGEDKLE